MTAAVPFLIRSATPADLPDVCRLVRGLAEYEKLLHEFTATEADFDQLLFAPDHVADALVATLPDRGTVGLALFHRTVGTFKGQIGLFLEDLFVEPDLRGKGIGKALLATLARIAVERGHPVIEWRVLNWNAPSIAVYERIGSTKMTEWHVRRLTGSALATLAQGESQHG